MKLPTNRKFCAGLSRIVFLLLLAVGFFVSSERIGLTQTPTSATVVPPFNLVWDAVDDNGIPLNPRWAWRILHPAPDRSLPDPALLCDSFPVIFRVPGDPSSGVVGIGRGDPPCTDQEISFDSAGFSLNSVICSFGPGPGKFQGHVNWFPATYTGPIFWAGHGDWRNFDDDDYNIDLAPPDLATLVTASQTLHTEFDSDETIDHFHSPWWESFHNAVDEGSGNIITGAEAIEIGLLGLDCEHSCSVELHPVWAIAIHDPSRSGPADDVWAIFVRNWGNEGYCSSKNHLLDLNTITFKLKWRPGATSVSLKPSTDCKAPAGSTQFCTNSDQTSWSFTSLPNECVKVTFNLPQPEAGARINGELHLQWSGPGVGDPCAGIRSRLDALQAGLNQLLSGIPGNKAEIPGVVEAAERRVKRWHQVHDQEFNDLKRRLAQCQNPNASAFGPIASLVPLAERRGGAEGKLQDLQRKMTPAQNQILLKKLKKDRTVDGLTPKLTGARATLTSAPHPPRVREVSSPQKVEKDRRIRDALCAAFGGKVPGFPDACKQ